MSYSPEHYNAVFEAMRRVFGEEWYASVDWQRWGVIWRARIKRDFFDEGILIREMVAGLEEAAGKGRWPLGTSFFARLHDVCLKNRREQRPSRVDGMHGVGDIMQRKHFVA